MFFSLSTNYRNWTWCTIAWRGFTVTSEGRNSPSSFQENQLALIANHLQRMWCFRCWSKKHSPNSPPLTLICQAVLHSKRGHCSEKPTYPHEESRPLTATRESPCAAVKTQRRQSKTQKTQACVFTQWKCESRSVMSDSLWPHGLFSPWDSPGQNTGVGSRSLLQGVFPTQEMRAFNMLGCVVSFWAGYCLLRSVQCLSLK